ncbi:hypothetical protein BDV09DRAFT_195463 [Aspergillus tetrazonus]
MNSDYAGQACPRIPGIQIYEATPNEGLSDGWFTSRDNGFDSPKVRAGNASAYDWWYFDAIGTDGVSSLAVVYFVEASESGFTVTENFTTQDFVQISGTFPNGTTFSDFLFAENAIVSTMGDGSSGLWDGMGASWAGSPDLSDYLIMLDASHLGYEGTFSMHSVSCPSPHYPCSPKRTNETMEVLPGVGWASSISDADVTVNMTIHGSTLSFIGTGYHDKNWGVIPFTDAVGAWYWGHARMGPYSLVWLDSLTPSKDEHASGYVAYHGQILHAECNKMKVRPTGSNVYFPPQGDDSLPKGFIIEVDLGGELGVLKAELASKLATLTKPGYGRWIGTVNGIVGGLSYEGVSGPSKVGLPRASLQPREPEFSIERTVTTIDGLWIYGWPSKGGPIFLSHPTRVDFDYLGWDYLDPPRKGDQDQDAEDEVCKMLLRLGATWYDSRSRYNFLAAVVHNVTGAQNQFLQGEVPAVTTVESLWVRVGWSSTGGLWVAESIHGAFEDVVDDSVEWNEQDNHYGNAAGQIVLAKDMDERCEILKLLGGRFYAGLDDYHGNGCLKMWEQKTTGEVGPLVRTRYLEW